MAECLHCGAAFAPRRAGHVFCSNECRHRGERGPGQRQAVDHGAVARLFDSSRDPDELVRVDDWHPGPQEWMELDLHQTVGKRRHWYERLALEGRL